VKSWWIAGEMCSIAARDGIDISWPARMRMIVMHLTGTSSYPKLEELQRRTTGSLAFSLGCDFHLSYENVEDALAHPGRYTIGDGGYLLVEFSDYSIHLQIDKCFARSFAAGITPVLTHPERNPILQKRWKVWPAGSILELNGPSTRPQRLASPRSWAWKRKPKRSANAAISATGTIWLPVPLAAGAAQHHDFGVVYAPAGPHWLGMPESAARDQTTAYGPKQNQDHYM